MLKITAISNEKKNGLFFPSEYNRLTLLQWLKDGRTIVLTTDSEETTKGRRYLEGAIVPAYCEWQYKIDPRDRGKDEQRRILFKQDFHYELIEDRNGDPKRAVLSTRGEAGNVARKYTEWAQENGAPVPNAKLFKIYRDQWSIDPRFPTFYDFLSFLDLKCDSMPSNETMEKLKKDEVKLKHPEEENELDKIPF